MVPSQILTLPPGRGRLTAAHLLVLSAIVASCYAVVVGAPFHFDDYRDIVGNEAIRHPVRLVERSLPPPGDTMLSEGFAFGRLMHSRIAGYLTFAAEYRVYGLDPRGYHATNIAVHLAMTWLVYFLARRLLRRPATALFAASLFAAHPVQTMAVSYVAQRFASLSSFWYLATVLLYGRSGGAPARSRPWWYAASLVTANLAFWTKESTLTLPVMLALCDRLREGPVATPRFRRLLPFVIGALAVPLSHLADAGSLAAATTAGSIGRLDYLRTELRVIATYLRMLVLPYGLNVDHDYPVVPAGSAMAWIAPLLLHVVLLAAAWRLLSHRRRRLRVAGFGILWFYLALSVESSLIPIGDVINEYRLYLPSVGFIIAAAAVADELLPRSFRHASVAIMVVAALATATVGRNLLWADGTALWRDAAEKSPLKTRPREHYANFLALRGETAAAERQYRQVLRQDPQLVQARQNLGLLLAGEGRFGDAAVEFGKLVEVAPLHADGWQNLAQALDDLGRVADAEAARRQASLLRSRAGGR